MLGEHAGLPRDARWAAGAHCGLVYASQHRERTRLATWMSTALARGWRVLHKHTGPAETTRARVADLAGPAALETGQVELIDAATCHADTAGLPATLLEWHRNALKQAHSDGYNGVAITCDGPALRTIAPNPAHMLTHEHDLSELAATSPMTVYCRYHTGSETPDTLTALAGHHRAGFEDLTWAAATGDRPNRLRVAGEIDATNADRFAAVLRAGIDQGIRVLDAAELEFLAAAGVGKLHAMLPLLRDHGAVLTLEYPTRLVRRVLDISGLTDSEQLRLAP